MSYTVITRKGTVKQFYIRSVAELYRNINGGVVFSQQILKEVDKVTV